MGLKPADLNDPWEVTRVQRLPKGGTNFNQSVVFYIRQGTTHIKVTYMPMSGVLGDPTLQVTVRLDRCTSPTCSAFNAMTQQLMTWSRVNEFLSWDNAGTNPSRTNPELSYFPQGYAADVSATNTCSGWDPNTDTTSDRFSLYSLRWPTNSSDPRGAFFTVGDVIPLDWTNDHLSDIQVRLAPNLAGNPLATPDFRIAPYLRNLPLGSDAFLRLKDENRRPLTAVGSTPLGNSLRSFRTWYAGCAQGTCPPTAGWQGVAAANDPDWLCRRKILVVLTDEGVDTCSVDPCVTAAALHSQQGVEIFAVGLGSDPAASSQLDCIAFNGGTGEALRPWTHGELFTTLQDIFAAAKQP